MGCCCTGGLSSGGGDATIAPTITIRIATCTNTAADSQILCERADVASTKATINPVTA
ncbi:Uncharacterised protein [Mycobacteroides abscessus subsp. abscessus]|nr:Uncharacterised protein [Mycobacteroides abscessus subsp. abscessus]